jgi:hypothetical protein
MELRRDVGMVPGEVAIHPNVAEQPVDAAGRSHQIEIVGAVALRDQRVGVEMPPFLFP